MIGKTVYKSSWNDMHPVHCTMLIDSCSGSTRSGAGNLIVRILIQRCELSRGKYFWEQHVGVDLEEQT